MKTIRTILEPALYEQMARWADLVAEGGNDAVFDGVRLLDAQMVRGTVVRTVMELIVWTAKRRDPSEAHWREVLDRIFRLNEGHRIETWGKLSILRGLALMQSAGVPLSLSDGTVETLIEQTDVNDYFDRETLDVHRGYPSNYLLVAMSTIGYRERLGWENGGYCQKLADRIVSLMQSESKDGWLDEQLPEGRFDRYTFESLLSFVDNFTAAGYGLPPYILDCLKREADVCLTFANRRGDGFNYGRSLAVYGDTVPTNLLASALAHGCAEDRETALEYCAAVSEKMLGFWYVKERGLFDVWHDGRAADGYRNYARVMELNLDAAHQLLNMERQLEKAGLADTPLTGKLPQPEKWTADELTFREDERGPRSLVTLRRGDLLVMLPLIGPGSAYKNSAYLPFPSLCGVIEAPPESALPYFVPEYRDRFDRIYRPMQFYEKITVERGNDLAVITARGKLAVCRDDRPKKSEVPFVSVYRFEGNRITATFEAETAGGDVQMLLGTKSNARMEPFGFDKVGAFPAFGQHDVCTPHGAMTDVRYCFGRAGQPVGYTITI